MPVSSCEKRIFGSGGYMRRTDFLDIFHLFCSKSLDFSIVNEYAKKAFVLKFEGMVKYTSSNDKNRCRNPIFTTKE